MVRPLVVNLLTKNTQKKVCLIVQCVMERVDMNTGEVITSRPYFRTKSEPILAATDVEEVYDNAVDRIKEKIANFLRQRSGWIFKSVIRLDIHTAVYMPLRGNTYIPLPPTLAAKKAIINPQNEDDQCFKWCVTRALNPVEQNAERIKNYEDKPKD